MKIGFVGLGQMGRHMAANMLKSGAELKELLGLEYRKK